MTEGKDAYQATYTVAKEPYYRPVADEVVLFERAYRKKQSVMLKGPTGCGKSRFVDYMSWKLKLPLVTTLCNEDTDASDLTGRYVLKGQEGVWVDGSLTLPVRYGGIGYLDEIVEGRADTMVLIHSLSDDRRRLRIPKTGEMLTAPDNFMLVVSFNPGYQKMGKDMKQSTRQRFVCLSFDYAPSTVEKEVIQKESGIDAKNADLLVSLGSQIRNMKQEGLAEGSSTRLLIYAAQQIKEGTAPKRACQIALRDPITDNKSFIEGIDKLIENHFK